MSDTPKEEKGPLQLAFTWLHVSDWHFKDASTTNLAYNASLNEVIEKIEKTVKSYRAAKHDDPPGSLNGLSIDCIIHTGDLAYSGKAAEYEEAQKALTRLAANLCVANNKVIITPGNHDVTDDAAFYPAELMHFRDEGEYVGAEERWFSRPKLLQILLERFDNFHAFKKHYGYAGPGEDTKAYYIQSLEFGSPTERHKVVIAAVNSALVSTRQDHEIEADLVLGQRRIRQVADEIKKDYKEAELRLLVFHHPFSFLNPRDALRCWEIIEDEFDVVLYGHKHLERDVMEHLTQVSGFPALDSGSIEVDAQSGCIEAADFTIGQYFAPASSSGFGEVRFTHFAGVWERAAAGNEEFNFHSHHRRKFGQARAEDIKQARIIRLTHPMRPPLLGLVGRSEAPLLLLKGATDLSVHHVRSTGIVNNFYDQRNARVDHAKSPTKSLIFPTKHFFWHIESRMLFECMASRPEYWLGRESAKVFNEKKVEMVK